MSETNGNGQWPLPEGWVWVKASNVGDIVTGTTPKKNVSSNYGNEVPFIKPGDLGDTEPVTASSEYLSSSGARAARLIPKGSVLVTCIGATIGKSGLSGTTLATNQQINSIVVKSDLHPKFVFYYCLSDAAQEWIRSNSSSTTLPIINKSKFSFLPIPLAPIPQQNRIVAEIEKQFTRLDAAVAALRRAKANLAPYKAAVLKAAVEGRLVAQDPADEPASELLARILAERRARWEATNPKKQYVEPKRPDVGGLPRLPVGWVWAGIEEVSEWIVDCLHSTPKFVTDGKYCIDTTCIEPAKILFDMARFVTDETFEERIRRLKPKAGDILFAREGTIGTAVMVPEGVELCLGQRMMQFRIVSGNLPEFIMWILLSPIFEQQWKPKVIGTTAPHVNIGDIRLMAIPLAPYPEQERIVKEIESRLSVLQTTEKALEANLARAERLRQAVLGKAFRGELVK